MRYPAAEKLEIIQLVEQSHLPVRRSLEQIGIPKSTFYRWCDLYQTGGPEALDDCSPRPDRVWNRIPDDVRARIVTLALDEPELSPRELAVRFTDAERYFVSEASVYRLLKAHDLITSPAFIVMKAADEFKDKTTAPNQLWQTDFTYLKVTGWGWFYLSTVVVPENPIRGDSRLKENQGNIICDACHPPSACDVRRRPVQTAAAAGSREPLSSSPAQHRPPACTAPSAAAWERPGVVGMDVPALAKPAQVGPDRSA